MLDTVFIYSYGNVMKKELPAKYYLAHFRELIEFVRREDWRRAPQGGCGCGF